MLCPQFDKSFSLFLLILFHLLFHFFPWSLFPISVSFPPLFLRFPSSSTGHGLYHRAQGGGIRGLDAHSSELRGSTASDLLDTELVQLGLQLLELLGELVLALSPELTGLDLGSRL